MKTFHKPITILSLFALLLVVVWACRKEKPAFDLSDKEPCTCASEVSADFKIEESGNYILDDLPDWVETDTVMHSSTVKFSALETDAQEYTWYIGSEVIHQPTVSRQFLSSWAETDIPITLVVKKTPSNVCFPDDDGYDSIVKIMHVSKYPIYPNGSGNVELGPIGGTYRFFAPHLNDSIDVSFNVLIRPGGDNSRYVDVTNVFGDGVDCDASFLQSRVLNLRTYRAIHFNRGAANQPNVHICQSISGLLIRRMDGVSTFRITHVFFQPSPNIVYQYTGRKL
jgi:hypothetical protein